MTALKAGRAVTGEQIVDGAIETAKLGSTIIQGGYIKTDLLDVDTILGNTAIFKGALSAATGTFKGDLNAVGGTFKGSLSAATGSFKGSLTAATGTFNGTVYAKNFEGDVVDNYVGMFPSGINIGSSATTLFTLSLTK